MATLFVATPTQSYSFAETNIGAINQTWPTVFRSSEMLAKHIEGLKTSPEYASECKAQAQYERNINTGVLVSTGVVVATFFGCIFAEWLQEFKVKKAEKAALIAKIQCKARQEQAACTIA